MCEGINGTSDGEVLMCIEFRKFNFEFQRLLLLSRAHTPCDRDFQGRE